MKTLKKILLPMIFIALAATALILIALASFKGSMGGLNATVKGITFGANKAITTYGGMTHEQTYNGYPPAVLPLVGFILIAVGVIAGGAVAFFADKINAAKIVLIAAAILVVVGGIFQFFAGAMFPGHVANKMIANGVIPESNRELVHRMFANMHANAAVYLTGVFGILGGAAIAVSQFLPEKK